MSETIESSIAAPEVAMVVRDGFRASCVLFAMLAGCSSSSGDSSGTSDSSVADSPSIDTSAGDSRGDMATDTTTSDSYVAADVGTETTSDSTTPIDVGTDVADTFDATDAGPSCATCVKMNAAAFDFGSDYLRYVTQDTTRLYWLSDFYPATISSMAKTATLTTPTLELAGDTEHHRDLTYRDGALYWVKEAADTSYYGVGRLDLATHTAVALVVEGSPPTDLYVGDALLDDGAHGLEYTALGGLYEVATGAAPGPRGTPTCTTPLTTVTGSDALSFYGQRSTGLVRVDRASCASTTLDSTITFGARVLLVGATDVYYIGASAEVWHVSKSATGPTPPTLVSAIPAYALVTADSPTSLSWAVSGSAGISRMDLGTGVVTSISTGTIAVDFVAADATYEYFFTPSPSSSFRNPHDLYRVAK